MAPERPIFMPSAAASSLLRSIGAIADVAPSYRFGGSVMKGSCRTARPGKRRAGPCVSSALNPAVQAEHHERHQPRERDTLPRPNSAPVKSRGFSLSVDANDTDYVSLEALHDGRS
jgi:hypothetical protein